MGLPSPMEASSGERPRRLPLGDYREAASPEGSLGGPMPARVSSREDWSISTAPCLRSGEASCREGGAMLGIGIDFAEEFHLVALGRPGEGVVEVVRVDHTPAAPQAPGPRIGVLAPPPRAEPAAELRAIARDDERAARDERRLLNRLRTDLIATFPAALAIAGDDLGAPTMLRPP